MNKKTKTGIKTGIKIMLATTLIFVLVPITEPVTRVEAGEETVAAASASIEETTADWNVMVERLDAAIANGRGENVNFYVGDTFVVPTDILSKLAGKNATLGLHAGNGIAFSVSGTDVHRTDMPITVNLSFEAVIPDEALQRIPTGIARQFSMQEKGAYPCLVNVHLVLGEENAGKHAVLYSYDEAGNCLKQEGIFRITQEGRAMFGLERGDEYAVAVMKGYTVAAGDTLSHIAAKNGVSLQALEAANPQIKDIDRIRIGQPVNIPTP